jgi:23S rRNA pseudouridine1911/1915/1917 synthase
MLRVIDQLKALGLSSGEARAALDSGKVRVNATPTRDPVRLAAPEDVVLNLRGPRLRPNLDLAVVWRDPTIAVIYKPPGMLSVPAPERRSEADVVGICAKHFGEAHPVHRLDEDTSGLMLVALRAESRAALIPMFSEKQIEREYLAIVKGQRNKTPQALRSTFVRDRGDGLRGSLERYPRARRAKDEEPTPAVTWVWGLEVLWWAGLVGLRLETGRTHQIRVHMSEDGSPVLGRHALRAAHRRPRRAAPRAAQRPPALHAPAHPGGHRPSLPSGRRPGAAAPPPAEPTARRQGRGR